MTFLLTVTKERRNVDLESIGRLLFVSNEGMRVFRCKKDPKRLIGPVLGVQIINTIDPDN